jgi:hypothetical protein
MLAMRKKKGRGSAAAASTCDKIATSEALMGVPKMSDGPSDGIAAYRNSDVSLGFFAGINNDIHDGSKTKLASH